MRNSGRYFLAGSLFLCWAILMATWYILPAILMAGRNYANQDTFYGELLAKYCFPVVLAWVSFAVAFFIALPVPWRSVSNSIKDEIKKNHER
jgi:hypothetical protein